MMGSGPSRLMTAVDRRGDLLRVLGEESLQKHELEEALDVSRSTIDRAIRELEELGLVRRRDDGYDRTLCGRIAMEEYTRFHRSISGLCEATELLESVDDDAPVDGALVAGARVVEATRASPHRPLEELYEVVDRAESVRGFAPAIHPQQVDMYRRRIVDEEMRGDLVVTEDAVQQLVSRYDDALEAGLDSDAAQFWRTDDDLSYSLTLATTPDGSHVGVLVYDDSGIAGAIINDTPAAVEWAERRFEEGRADASPLR
jgi:predicted transcriptional regulator